jgi:hypothetical protein
MLDVALTASIFLLAAHLVRRSESAHSLRFMRIAFLAIVFAAYLRWDEAENWLVHRTGTVAALLIPLVWCALAAMIATRPRVVRALRDFFLILSPFVVVTFGQGFAQMIHEWNRGRAEIEAAPQRLTNRADGPRVVWMLFDELDYRLVFDRRPETLAMPEIDRMRRQALHATSAYPPSEFTLSSIPALVDGRLVFRFEPRDSDQLMVAYHQAARPVRWGSEASVFSRVRQLGRNSAVVGWHHPYCRVFRDQLSLCTWEANADNVFAVSGDDLLAGMSVQAKVASQLLAPPPFKGAWYRSSMAQRVRKRMIQDHEALMREARNLLGNADVHFLLIHLSVPHPPGIFDRRTDVYKTDGDRSYIDNLKLADRTLGELRRVLEENGQWDDTIVVVSSDHAWRPTLHRPDFAWTAEDEEASRGHQDSRVPFLLKLPGQTTPVAYERSFNTVLTSELLLAILRGEVSDAEGVVLWLERHRSIGFSPYMENP